MERAHWIVRGHVQGVGFRHSVKRRAALLKVTCTVWNREDGAVECTALGTAEALDLLERWLRQGPPLARVDHVERVS